MATGWQGSFAAAHERPTWARMIMACSLAVISVWFVGPARAIAAGPAWRIVPSPVVESSNGGFAAVSCTSPRLCWAVGSYFNKAGIEAPLAGMWNGTGWSVKAVPRPRRMMQGRLNGVSCKSAVACIAVGDYSPSHGASGVPLAERWNGHRWRIMRLPAAPGARISLLSAVSCESTMSCIAVGYTATGSGAYDTTLAERWNGANWKIESTPDPLDGTGSDVLTGVSCALAASCTAVGWYGFGPNQVHTHVLAEYWGGASWAIQPIPNPSDTESATLAAVSCASAADCVAAGQYSTNQSDSALIERWNGHLWTGRAAPTPTSQVSNGLDGISCASTLACTAVGSYVSNNVPRTLAERWNGHKWTTQSSPIIGTGSTLSGSLNLNSVSCPFASECAAVGSFSAFAGRTTQTLAERWSAARWRIQTTSGPQGAMVSDLLGVSCTSAIECIAVGNSWDGAGVEIALAERWNGEKWKLQRTPSPDSATPTELTGVSCASPTACTAVGWSGEGIDGPTATFAERWNGRTWSIQTTPNPHHQSSVEFDGVSCVSASMCVAAGSFWHNNGLVTLSERWNGVAWTIESRSKPAYATAFDAVSCASATACEAVGMPGMGPTTFAEGWNGKQWQVQGTPEPYDASGASLAGVSCSSAQNCEAVGNYSEQIAHTTSFMTLIERWDGSAWKQRASPTTTTAGELRGVSCVHAGFCEAVGTNESGTLAERWNGKKWALQTTPSILGADYGVLNAVSCTSTRMCMSVGFPVEEYGS
jgi:hypothetical protein